MNGDSTFPDSDSNNLDQDCKPPLKAVDIWQLFAKRPFLAYRCIAVILSFAVAKTLILFVILFGVGELALFATQVSFLWGCAWEYLPNTQTVNSKISHWKQKCFEGLNATSSILIPVAMPVMKLLQVLG